MPPLARDVQHLALLPPQTVSGFEHASYCLKVFTLLRAAPTSGCRFHPLPYRAVYSQAAGRSWLQSRAIQRSEQWVQMFSTCLSHGRGPTGGQADCSLEDAASSSLSQVCMRNTWAAHLKITLPGSDLAPSLDVADICGGGVA